MNFRVCWTIGPVSKIRQNPEILKDLPSTRLQNLKTIFF
jgi:hypothetical protein